MTPRWSFVASGVHSSSHRKQVGMRGMQSGNAVMEGAAVAGQIAKESERKGGSWGKDRESEKVIRKGWGASNYNAHTETLGCLQTHSHTKTKGQQGLSYLHAVPV